jgi:hypothetical protein
MNTSSQYITFVVSGLCLGLSVQPTWAASEAPVKATDSSMHTLPASSHPIAGMPVSETGAPTSDDLQRAVARVKAEYLYRFLGYVDFPRTVLPQPDSPLVIGVMGAEDVYEALADTLPMRTVGLRQVLRRRLQAGDSLAGVHLVYAGGKVALQQEALISAARSSPVLLVTDAPGGLSAGAVFNFMMIGDQLRFEASLEAANRASLHVSSRVLVLAERVMGVR